jgi:hypothetical protein
MVNETFYKLEILKIYYLQYKVKELTFMYIKYLKILLDMLVGSVERCILLYQRDAYSNRLGTLELLLGSGNCPIRWNDTVEHYRIHSSSTTISIEAEQQDTGMSWSWNSVSRNLINQTLRSRILAERAELSYCRSERAWLRDTLISAPYILVRSE